ELGMVESNPKQDGRNMVMVIAPHRNQVATDAVRRSAKAEKHAAAEQSAPAEAAPAEAAPAEAAPAEAAPAEAAPAPAPEQAPQA
ncbi:MAG: infC, partial [Modestobacter sp.]|nr:infC [Modestobacter sp.]